MPGPHDRPFDRPPFGVMPDPPPFGPMPDPWQPLRDLPLRMQRLFEDLFNEPSGAERVRPTGIAWGLRVEISESAEEVRLIAEMPGVAPADVEVTVADSILTIRGEKKSEAETGGAPRTWHLTERSYGAFQRMFRLPDTIDGSRITASFDKGLLIVGMPKTAPAAERVRKIEIGLGGQR